MGIKSFFNSIFGSTPKEKKSNETFDRMRLSMLLGVDADTISKVLKNPSKHYSTFRMKKRRGGYRTISAPHKELLNIQKKINQQLLSGARIHPAAKGFRKKMSIVDNAKVHLGQKNILKVDISGFFGSINLKRITPIFEGMGHGSEVSKQLTKLCCIKRALPQGAPTSPALSNIGVYEMDKRLTLLAEEQAVIYSRYADDLTFSGEFEKNALLYKVRKIVEEEGFCLNDKKTHYASEKQRKIITGVSISSGKMTVPKAKKREIRKNVYFILKHGVDNHKAHIKSTDPAYIQRIIGYLSFWLSVEPESEFVKKSLRELKAIKK